MPREQLLGLAAEVDRLFAAGAGTAIGNDKLRQRGKGLRELTKQVPALVPVADAVDRLTEATSKQAPTGLLELLGMTRQLRASLAAPGLAGELTALPPSGPWRTQVPVREVSMVAESLGEAGSGREQVLRDAVERKTLGDLRLVPVLLSVLEGGAAGLADKVVNDALPLVGPALLPELQAKLNLQGDGIDARRLEAIGRIDPTAGAALCRQALTEGSVAVRVRAIECLADVGTPDEAEKIGLQLLSDKDKKVRMAALSALRTGTSDAALDTLLTTLLQTQDRETTERASRSLQQLAHPRTTERLLHELQAQQQAYEQAPATIAKLKKSQAKTAPAPKKGAKAVTTPLQEAEEARQQVVNNLHWLVTILGRRNGPGREAAADAILPFLDHPEESVSLAVCSSLHGTGTVTPKLLTAFVGLLADKNPKLVRSSGNILGAIEPAQRESIVPELLTLAKKAEPYQLECILRLFAGHFNKHGKAMLPLLRSALKTKANYVAAQVLAEIGPPAREALPDLLAYVESGASFYSAIISPIDPEGTDALPQIIKLLDQTKKETTRRVLLQELIAYGPRAKEAAPVVAKLAQAKSNLSNYADFVLKAIQG